MIACKNSSCCWQDKSRQALRKLVWQSRAEDKEIRDVAQYVARMKNKDGRPNHPLLQPRWDIIVSMDQYQPILEERYEVSLPMKWYAATMHRRRWIAWEQRQMWNLLSPQILIFSWAPAWQNYLAKRKFWVVPTFYVQNQVGSMPFYVCIEEAEKLGRFVRESDCRRRWDVHPRTKPNWKIQIGRIKHKATTVRLR